MSLQYQTMSGVGEGPSKGRPVGQVAPAQRSTDSPGGAGAKLEGGEKGPIAGRGRGSPRCRNHGHHHQPGFHD